MSSLTQRRFASWIFGLSLLFTSVGETLSEKDADKLKQLTIEVFNSTSIVVRWSSSQHPGRSSGGDRPSSSCPVQRHIVRLRQDGQKQSRTWRFDGARLSAALHDLRPSTVYQVRVLAIDCDNKRRTSRWTRVTTRDDAPAPGQESRLPGKPNDVRTMTQSEAVVVTWRPPDDDVIVRGYIIGYGEGVPDVNWRYLNASQRNVTLRNLKPQTQYVISVRAFNNVGKGHVIYDIVHTKEASAASSSPLPPPADLRPRMLSSTTAILQWSDPSLDPTQRIADERYYNVYYQSLPNGKNLSVIVKALQVTLYDLLPNRNYRFTVRTIKGSTTSPFSQPVSGRTPSAGNTKDKTSTTTPRNYEEEEEDEYIDYEIEARPGQDEAFIDGGEDPGPQGPQGGPGPHGPQGGPGPQGGGGEAKAKRDNTVVHESLARTLSNTSSSTTSSSSTASDVRVTSFRAVVQYRVSAYVTWPERPPGPCTTSSGADDVTATYLFRYKAVDDDVGDYVIRSLATNFVLLEDLIPNTRYRYQVRYLATDRGNATSWSQEATLDTSYNPSSNPQ